METLLHYGNESRISVDLGDPARIAHCRAPREQSLTDLSRTVAEAVADPLDFPPLGGATVPGDRIVLAVSRWFPRLPDVVAGVVGELLMAGADPARIVILLPPGGDSDGDLPDPRECLNREIAADLTWSRHDPLDRGQLAYLAATRTGRPLYLNRLLLDADLIIPVDMIQHAATAAATTLGLYPTFADAEGCRDFGASGHGQANGGTSDLHRELEEILWLLGVQFSIQLVPGPGSRVLDVVAGEIGSAARRAREICHTAWTHDVDDKAELVIATVEGDASQQTWSTIARAVAAAAEVVVENGSIAVCSELAEDPGPGLRLLCNVDNVDDREAALRQIRTTSPSDAVAAERLAQALERARVYVMSQLDETQIEQLGMAAVCGPAELARLAARHRCCIILESAQHAQAVVCSRGCST